MNITKTRIPDVLLIDLKVFEDERGCFFESYNKKLFTEHSIEIEFIQDNHVFSKRGVLRGLHYQTAPHAQAKLVRVIRGSIFDVAVDIRKGSPTFGQYVGVTLRATEKRMIYVPTGFAHGYLSLEDSTEVLYKVSGIYSPEHERGILWNDTAVGVRWPKLDGDYIVSEKDKKLTGLNSADLF